jgi:hypothetical protein
MDESRFPSGDYQHRTRRWGRVMPMPIGLLLVGLGSRSIFLGLWNEDGASLVLGGGFILVGGVWFLIWSALKS